ncbi:hypothetical protein BC940DRAFT_335676 [Gongronella butleri]|nr:hypothetical protein BC940DRAFT_335676 [Gongronella butleri]
MTQRKSHVFKVPSLRSSPPPLSMVRIDRRRSPDAPMTEDTLKYHLGNSQRTAASWLAHEFDIFYTNEHIENEAQDANDGGVPENLVVRGLFRFAFVESTVRIMYKIMHREPVAAICSQLGVSRKNIAAVHMSMLYAMEEMLDDEDFEVGGYHRNLNGQVRLNRQGEPARIIVEIDESKFGKRKYHRGHRVEANFEFWVLHAQIFLMGGDRIKSDAGVLASCDWQPHIATA